jgi:hypothetical protein
VQSESRAPLSLFAAFSDQGVARSSAYAFPETVHYPGCQDKSPAGGYIKNELTDGRSGVAEYCKRFSRFHLIREITRKYREKVSELEILCDYLKRVYHVLLREQPPINIAPEPNAIETE